MNNPSQNHNPFKKAVKYDSKLRLAIASPSGAGKTYTALTIATAFAQALGTRAALIDTEHGSASKYADIFDFDHVDMAAPFHPDRYIEFVQAAEANGYGVLVIDQLSHGWSGMGGLLELVDDIALRSKSSNSFFAWKEATPIQNRMIEGLLAANMHLIVTLRSKQDYVIEEDDRGKKVPKKLGLAPIQREGLEFEFDVFAEMDMDNTLLIQKTRCPALAGKVIRRPTAELATTLLDWLRGEKAPEKPKVQPAPKAQPVGKGLVGELIKQIGEMVKHESFSDEDCVQIKQQIRECKSADAIQAILSQCEQKVVQAEVAKAEREAAKTPAVSEASSGAVDDPALASDDLVSAVQTLFD